MNVQKLYGKRIVFHILTVGAAVIGCLVGFSVATMGAVTGLDDGGRFVSYKIIYYNQVCFKIMDK